MVDKMPSSHEPAASESQLSARYEELIRAIGDIEQPLSLVNNQATLLAAQPRAHAIGDDIPLQERIDHLSDVRWLIYPLFISVEHHQPQILLSLHPSGPFYAQEFRHLRRLCRESGLIPTSSKLPKEVVLSSSSPKSSSHFSDIYQGRFGDRDVAVKVLRLHMDEARMVKKVRSFQHTLNGLLISY
jgi:hypothetical protein